METGKSKEKQGGSKEWEEEKEEDSTQELCCRPQGGGVAKGTILLQHGCGRVIHRCKGGHGSPRQQLGQDSLFVASPAVSCRMWSPAQTTAVQAVLPPTCSLRVVAGGLAKVPVSFLPRYPEGMEETD